MNLLHKLEKRFFCSHSCAAKNSNKARVAEKILCPNCGKEKSKTGKFCRKCSSFLRFKSTLYIKTKGELLKERGYFNTRALIQGHALFIYKKSDREFKCKVCGYNTYAEVCHIKSVSSFSEESTILEINDINNLVALCPNHHWEFDHGKIIL